MDAEGNGLLLCSNATGEKKAGEFYATAVYWAPVRGAARADAPLFPPLARPRPFGAAPGVAVLYCAVPPSGVARPHLLMVPAPLVAQLCAAAGRAPPPRAATAAALPCLLLKCAHLNAEKAEFEEVKFFTLLLLSPGEPRGGCSVIGRLDLGKPCGAAQLRGAALLPSGELLVAAEAQPSAAGDGAGADGDDVPGLEGAFGLHAFANLVHAWGCGAEGGVERGGGGEDMEDE